MIELGFETTGQKVFLRISKSKKLVWIKSAKTNYQWERKNWLYLFDYGIYWAKPDKKYKVGLKKMPLKIKDLEKNATLRKLHNLSLLDVKSIKNENEKMVLREINIVDNMDERDFKYKIVAQMEDIGYKRIFK